MPGNFGLPICNTRNRDSWGTLACVVRDRSDANLRYILSASHVMYLNGYGEYGDSIQWYDGTRWRDLAKLERWTTFSAASGALQRCDAAIARIIETSPDAQEALARIGSAPPGIRKDVYAGLELNFHGAKSGTVTNARLHSTGNVVPALINDAQTGENFTLLFAGQILYGVANGEAWSTAGNPGDSGALVIDQLGYAVGLHIARTPDDYGLSLSVCTPIQTVLDELRVDLGTASGGTVVSPPIAPSPVAPSPVAPSPVAPSPVAPAPVAPTPVAVTATGLPSADETGERSFAMLGLTIRSLLDPHTGPFGGATWQLTRDGLIVGGQLQRTPGTLVTVPRVWNQFSGPIIKAADEYDVPLELIIATICTESGGNPLRPREEPGWKDDESTPDRVSAGLMHTLLSTARWILNDRTITRNGLADPGLSIRAGTAYIAYQRADTRFDPPLVACAYNAGSLQENSGATNRWRMLQHPLGSGAHADRFVLWFNDCVYFLRVVLQGAPASAPSFHRLFWGT